MSYQRIDPETYWMRCDDGNRVPSIIQIYIDGYPELAAVPLRSSSQAWEIRDKISDVLILQLTIEEGSWQKMLQHVTTTLQNLKKSTGDVHWHIIYNDQQLMRKAQSCSTSLQ